MDKDFTFTHIKSSLLSRNKIIQHHSANALFRNVAAVAPGFDRFLSINEWRVQPHNWKKSRRTSLISWTFRGNYFI